MPEWLWEVVNHTRQKKKKKCQNDLQVAIVSSPLSPSIGLPLCHPKHNRHKTQRNTTQCIWQTESQIYSLHKHEESRVLLFWNSNAEYARLKSHLMVEKLIAHSADVDPCCLEEKKNHPGYFVATVETWLGTSKFESWPTFVINWVTFYFKKKMLVLFYFMPIGIFECYTLSL